MSKSTMDQLNEAHEKGVVLGLAGFGTGQRVDIDVMLTEQPDTFNLYLIALMELQGMEDLPWTTPEDYSFKPGSKNLKMSWFQLTGIHGLPLSKWDGEGDKGYYCTHSMANFGTWHRPYLAMMEQTLFRQVANVAKRFSESNIPDEEKKKYLDAAKKFRIPYWDYYRPRSYTKPIFPGVAKPEDGTTTGPLDFGAPQIFTVSKVMVRRLPDNKLIPMANPFLQFTFSLEQYTKIAGDAGFPEQFTDIKETIRHGGSDEKATASMNAKLNRIREDEIRICLALIQDEVYRNFKTFSTNAVLKPNENLRATLDWASGSLEDFHNKYHGYIGGNGHMSFRETAAFDPIFWMHHCQIDRVFAIWQAANDEPGKDHWFNELDPKDQPLGKADLEPFRKSVLENKEKQYWNSDMTRKTTDFGYIYSDLANGQTGDTVRKEFREKYEWSRRTTATRAFATPPKDMRPIQVGGAPVFNFKGDTSPGGVLKNPDFPMEEMQQQTIMSAMTSNAMTSNSQYADDWYIDIVVERMLADGSYTIFYIIGEVQGKTGDEWSSLPGFVGMSHILAAPRSMCKNCARQDDEGKLVTSTTAITSLLLDYVEIGKLRSMEEDDVKQFLIENLKWRAQTVLGEVLDPRHMAKNHSFNLSISRKRTPVPRSTGDVQYDTYPEVIDAIISNSS
ncbi:Tyrosinase [Fusarium coicis]|nr:Tyrosinase [Fusarium coicis]